MYRIDSGLELFHIYLQLMEPSTPLSSVTIQTQAPLPDLDLNDLLFPRDPTSWIATSSPPDITGQTQAPLPDLDLSDLEFDDLSIQLASVSEILLHYDALETITDRRRCLRWLRTTAPQLHTDLTKALRRRTQVANNLAVRQTREAAGTLDTTDEHRAGEIVGEYMKLDRAGKRKLMKTLPPDMQAAVKRMRRHRKYSSSSH